jgi:hypothetical protein
MSKPQEVAELLDRALEQAFINQFMLLFNVLMQAEDLEQGLVRFERGLQKLLETGNAVATVITNLEATS